MSGTYSSIAVNFINAITLFQKKKRRALTRALTSERLASELSVRLDGHDFIFHCPSSGAVSAAYALDTQEPETRQWIRDYVDENEVIWDIGANIGLYSLYAAKVKAATVFAFEPNAGTSAILANNIMLNACEDRITPVQIALSDQQGVADFYLWRKGAGHALSSIGRPENVFGSFEPEGHYKCLETTPDRLAEWSGITKPEHIKLDVDGHEMAILRGAEGILNNVKTVCIEWEPSTPEENDRVKHLLESHGLQMVTSSIEDSDRNVIFVRSKH